MIDPYIEAMVASMAPATSTKKTATRGGHRTKSVPMSWAVGKWGNRVTSLDEEPSSDPVDLQNVMDADHRLNAQQDKT